MAATAHDADANAVHGWSRQCPPCLSLRLPRRSGSLLVTDWSPATVAAAGRLTAPPPWSQGGGPDPGRSRDQGGSGLGLSIAAAIVSAHGGRISLHPTPGGGATFRIELPLAAAEPEAALPNPAAEGFGH